MLSNQENDKQPLSFWMTRKGILLQVIIVLIPSALLLKSGTLLLAGLFISLILSTIGLRLRRQTWHDAGLKRPANIGRVLLTAFGWTFALIILTFALRHLVTFMTREGPNLAAFKPVKGNIKGLLMGLAVAWTLGAFGEEMFFRGFLMNAFYRLLPDSHFNDSIKWGVALVVTSVMVGFGHAYQGITGMILTGIIAFGLGLIYLTNKNNLWPGIVTHGLYDTVAFVLVFSGFSLDQLIKG